MKKRWYDHDPAMSMAVSLLQNASAANQLKTVEYCYSVLEEMGVLAGEKVKQPMTLEFIFPFRRRNQMEQATWRLLEVMKHLPYGTQQEMAMNIIHFVYRLDSHMDAQGEEWHELDVLEDPSFHEMSG